ncbi:GIY-YIG nuclease family protein [Arthrobacter sp. NPDC058130]|uniref:GIY-YIG nuclease family protein n=1 Tax=Arthrobacter sp. NPDC058130 TaxID=3346353 RepID=UPI0036E620DB
MSVGLFGGKKQMIGWHATDDPSVMRYFDGQRWRGRARLTALDHWGPLPFPGEAQRLQADDELIERQSQIQKAVAACEELGQKRSDLERQIRELRQERAEVEHENFLHEINLWDFPTVADGSAKIAEALKEVRAQAKHMVRDGLALSTDTKLAAFFDINSGFDSPIRKHLRQNITTMVLGIFNAECEAATRAMRSMSSLTAAGDRIRRSWTKLHEATMPIGVMLSDDYVKLKLKESQLVWEHLAAKAIDRAEAQDARDRQREEARAQAEYEVALDGLEKELDHYLNMLATMQRQGDVEGVERFEGLIEETKGRIAAIEERSANIRVGYVYVISNIGSFGEGVVKIGLTRRLEPMDRVRELSSASVPFRYDVHAMIFSMDAVSLENRLHQHFDAHRINRINRRREFFRVTPHQVLEALKSHEADIVEWIEDPEAEEYRLTLDQARLELESSDA